MASSDHQETITHVGAEVMPKPRAPQIDRRILEPGWAGEPEPAEFQFLAVKLARDRRLAARWGFPTYVTQQLDWAILQVAMWGDPEQKALNAALASQRFSPDTGLQLPLL